VKISLVRIYDGKLYGTMTLNEPDIEENIIDKNAGAI
jgi:hypothetical protein